MFRKNNDLDSLYERLQAEKGDPAAGIRTLRDIYVLESGGRNALGSALAKDREAMNFFAEYWSYVMWNEGGNQSSFSELGFEDFIDLIKNPWDTYNYLAADGMNAREARLYRKLKKLCEKYGVCRR